MKSARLRFLLPTNSNRLPGALDRTRERRLDLWVTPVARQDRLAGQEQGLGAAERRREEGMIEPLKGFLVRVVRVVGKDRQTAADELANGLRVSLVLEHDGPREGERR